MPAISRRGEVPPHSPRPPSTFTAAVPRPLNRRDDPLLDDSGSSTSDEDEPPMRSLEVRRHRLPLSVYSLIYENLSLFLAATALFGVIIMLRTYDYKPNWSPGLLESKCHTSCNDLHPFESVSRQCATPCYWPKRTPDSRGWWF